MTTLSRYTSISAMLDLLLNRRLVLVDPSTWSDQNDREVMEVYARLLPGRRVFAACLAEGRETAHHWQVFADGGRGASVRFDRDRLCAAIAGPDVIHGPMAYVQWRDLSPTVHLGDSLPFLKRNVFRFENEYRIVARVSEASDTDGTFALPIPLHCLTSIYVSGEWPPLLFDSLVTLIRTIPGCRSIPIRQSGLRRNENWSRSLADLLAPG